MQETAKETDKSTLKLQYRLFIDAYLKEPNATKAAIIAGYSEKTAKQQGSRLLTQVDIVAEMERIKQKVTASSEISAEWILTSLKNVAERCMQAVPVMEKTDGEWKETGEFRFDSTGANKALETLGKNLNLWKDVGSKENPLTGNVTVSMSKEDAAL
jgi:phage terminase small subunit